MESRFLLEVSLGAPGMAGLGVRGLSPWQRVDKGGQGTIVVCSSRSRPIAGVC